MKVYARPGQSLQQIGGICPEGWVVMQSERPAGLYVAREDGSWAEASAAPRSVTRRQGRLALIDARKLLDVEDAISAIADPVARLQAQVEYEADVWERGNVFLQAMWAQLGGTESQLDDLFILASTK